MALLKEDISKLLKIMKLSGQIILENGGETYRAEETIQYIGNSLGVKEVDSLATPTGIYLTISTDGINSYTAIRRIKKRTVHLEKLYEVNNLSRQISDNCISLDEAVEKLEGIINTPQSNSRFSLLYGALTTAFFTVLFGGRIFDFIISFLIGFLVTLINRKFESIHSYHFVSNLVSGIVIATIAIGSTYLIGLGNYQVIILGGMMPQLPGLAMTNAIRDTIRGDLVSGVTRTAEALLISASLAVGSGVIMSIAYGMNLFSI